MINATSPYNMYESPYQNNSKMRNFSSTKPTNSSIFVAKPVESVQKTIETSVDTFVKKVDEEKEKKSNKKAIAAGSAALVATGLVAILNPKFSTKFISKLKTMSQNAGIKFEKNKENYLTSKFHKNVQNILNKSIKFLEFTNNGNALKDIYFKKLCTEKKTFSKVKNNKIKNFLIKADNIFVSGMSKVHNGITKWFDKISKKTVFSSYKKVNKQMDDFENVVNQLIKDLPDNEKQEIKKIFNEINTLRKYYTNNAIENRLNKQEGLMKSLETDFMKKYKKYIIKLKNDSNSRATTIDDNLEYWAESILNNNKDTLLTNNDQKVTALTSAYDKLLQKLTKLNPRDKHSLRNRINKIDKNLNSANEKECIKYFDKKRDLTLGGGPTDIVTSLGSIGLCGLSVASADNKEDRISKMLTTGFPLIAGVGASLAFTAMLFSGIQGMMLGFGSSIILSKIGSIINKHIFGKNIDEQNTKTNSTISNNPFIQQEEPNV